MSTVAPPRTALTAEQLEAVEARGDTFVSAGAGTGKTSVLVERFVRAVCDDGVDVGSVLVITYTRKAAGELRTRVRSRLEERGRYDLARELDGAWMSTIHGFCHRLLRAYPFAAGLDPRFRELDEPGAAVLRGEAFERALTAFCTEGDEARLRLLAIYGAARLRRMLVNVFETLRSAGRELVLELGEGAGLASAAARLGEEAAALCADRDATEAQRSAASAVLALLERGATAERLLDLSGFRCRGERAATFEEARKRSERAALEELAAGDRDLLQALLELFVSEYEAAKRRESAVDFEDLQLAARDLLRADAAVRDAEQLRFRMIMVDEFQDTNRLQCELVDLVAGGPAGTEVFYVGDEFQSIYGFRHADVEVFRARRAASGTVLALRRNFRSRPEVLAAVNHLFEAEFGDDYQPLAASGDFPDPVLGHPVELLVTDKASYEGSGEHWRRAEARHIARRVRSLVDAGDAETGEIVLLFAAGTDAECYEEELRRLGLPTLRATGRGYFGQQQVADLLAYLALLRNRYDDLALASVLASPFVGVSNDALVLLRRAAPSRPLFTALERGLPESLDADDARLARAFLQRYERLVAVASRLSLEQLCDLVLTEHDYDLAVLARWDGDRRYANLRKLARLARSYEGLRGADLEGFLRFVRDQEAVGARELEAVAEEEGTDAVRLLTIHGAKGLEFKVVIVADAGRDTGGPPSADEIVVLADGRFGLKVQHPIRGGREAVFDYDAVREARERQERAERLRLYYVAMTRAVDRLIVSGAIDPARPADRQTPIGWVLGRLGVGEELAAAGPGPLELQRGEARLLVRVDRFDPARTGADDRDAEPLPETAPEPGQLALFTELPSGEPPPAIVLPELVEVPAPPPLDLRRLSFSALALFERCPYRFWAERAAGMRARPRRAALGGGDPALVATELGDAVHRLLETVDLAGPAAPARDQLAAAVRAWYPSVTESALDRIAAFVQAYCDSSLAARVAALGTARPERPFAFEHDGVLLHGRLDVLWREGDRALVLDYKTNALDDEPAAIVEAGYGLQRLVYALACLRDGATDVEVVYQFLERPEEPVAAVFGREDAERLGRELSAAIDAIRAGRFPPSPSELACADCPARGVVCAGLDLPG